MKDSFEKNKWTRYYYGGVNVVDFIPSKKYHELTESEKVGRQFQRKVIKR